ncbi:hypothetical protein TNCT_652031 [Trichonephila clavata]|uniref:Uncharacterized protein n=1 Tax=Trichonephila clavata TaxID=2740835 RepID=A0A8X6JKM3_TRICU|nr:hypothetical protein TNCT_652031 [Trichonephila clavata]
MLSFRGGRVGKRIDMSILEISIDNTFGREDTLPIVEACNWGFFMLSCCKGNFYTFLHFSKQVGVSNGGKVSKVASVTLLNNLSCPEKSRKRNGNVRGITNTNIAWQINDVTDSLVKDLAPKRLLIN